MTDSISKRRARERMGVAFVADPRPQVQDDKRIAALCPSFPRTRESSPPGLHGPSYADELDSRFRGNDGGTDPHRHRIDDPRVRACPAMNPPLPVTPT
jgi:hypothetical protein